MINESFQEELCGGHVEENSSILAKVMLRCLLGSQKQT